MNLFIFIKFKTSENLKLYNLSFILHANFYEVLFLVYKHFLSFNFDLTFILLNLQHFGLAYKF